MSYALTDTLADAEALVAQIDTHLGYPRNGTTTHAVPREHPTVALWAIALDRLDVSEPWLADALVDLSVVDRLDDDWNPGGYP